MPVLLAPRCKQQRIKTLSVLIFAKEWNQQLQERFAGLEPLSHPMDGLRTMQELITVNQNSTIT